jgi:hypothetical protein
MVNFNNFAICLKYRNQPEDCCVTAIISTCIVERSIRSLRSALMKLEQERCNALLKLTHSTVLQLNCSRQQLQQHMHCRELQRPDSECCPQASIQYSGELKQNNTTPSVNTEY